MSRTTIPDFSQSPNWPVYVDVVEDLDSKLAGAHAILDLIFVLANTGDLESLCQHSLSSSISEAMASIDAARNLMAPLAVTANAAPELHQALQAALVVVAGCNADGAFNTQERAIRAALTKTERGAA